MINRPSDLIPAEIVPVMTSIGGQDWVEIDTAKGSSTYRLLPKIRLPKILEDLLRDGQDWLAVHSMSRWLASGPKIVRPTLRQCEMLRHVEIRVPPQAYSQPYPHILVDLPEGFVPHVKAILTSLVPMNDERMLVALTFSTGRQYDVVNPIKLDIENDIEAAITRFYDKADVGKPGVRENYIIDEDIAQISADCFRVAINVNMLLTNYGVKERPLLPQELESDRRLARRGGEAGERAAIRCRTALRLLEIDQEILLTLGERRPVRRSDPQGGHHASPTPHWRRGHWAMVRCGVGKKDTRAVLRPEVFVNEDDFFGDPADIRTVYRDK